MNEVPDPGWTARLEFQQLPDDANELTRRWHALSMRQMPGPGWAALLDELHRQLVALDSDYALDQVKEKFGTLRFYARFDPAVASQCNALVAPAEQQSARICERCGRAGQPRSERVWVLTLCDGCHATEPAGRPLPNEWAPPG